ncbi:hypothetical protein Y032_0326g2559 [Ancylostoma ceylanicum]|uniref:Uncharacterized protein n=1 Tax=Ancylostoma ceylanicum TaxID=53326 RepID=A0A016S108_9BILA|nr:hypothetical protein Y032_0326g2559 [Ancylostoma ceylanicum]
MKSLYSRFCCDLTSTKRILSNTNEVPVMLKAVRKSAEIIVQYSFVERTAAQDDVENWEEPNIVFGAGEKTVGANNEFELEIQKPLEEGEVPPADEEQAVAHDDGAEAVEGTIDDMNSIHADFYALPSLDPDLEEMLKDEENVEIDSTS